jgi:hypothetical protein
MNVAAWVLGLLVALLTAAVGELVSDEIRARLDRLPFAVLAAASRRLPAEQQDEQYRQAWLPELHHILRGEEATPITRLVRRRSGLRTTRRPQLSRRPAGGAPFGPSRPRLNPRFPAGLRHRVARCRQQSVDDQRLPRRQRPGSRCQRCLGLSLRCEIRCE